MNNFLVIHGLDVTQVTRERERVTGAGAVAWSCHGNSMISVRNGNLHGIPGILPGSKSNACLRSLLVVS